ncbi:MAG: ABC transporter ATP-binding protein, partial [Porphyrobacter sp.]|nr:ABC transporter ATP-binding protein [Porphyrobacter sp.]
ERAAVAGVSLEIRPGETLGIVGESGSGKTTTARIVLALIDPDSGNVTLRGKPWTTLKEKDRRQRRRRVSVVYQDPLSSFDPRWTVRRIVDDAIAEEDYEGKQRRLARVKELLGHVGIGEELLERRPLQLSGGQRQRVAIARAILRDAPILLLDEATSALDAESERLVQQALERLMKDRTTLVIAHRLATVRAADRIVVLDAGRIVEEGTHAELQAGGGLYARLAALQFQDVQDVEPA